MAYVRTQRITTAIDLYDGSTMGGDTLAKIAYGTYSGNGAVSQAITGIGFQPRVVWIMEDVPAESVADNVFFKMEGQDADLAFAHTSTPTHSILDNRLISLDADGFTVGDDGGDSHPNKNGVDYIYLAIG